MAWPDDGVPSLPLRQDRHQPDPPPAAGPDRLETRPARLWWWLARAARVLLDPEGEDRRDAGRSMVAGARTAGPATGPGGGQGRYYVDFRGLRRIWTLADPEYRFYRSTSAPPQEGSTPFETATALPHTTAATFTANRTYRISASLFNGVIDSGFYPVGDRNETYHRLELDGGGTEELNPPAGPNDVRLEQLAGGVVRITAHYLEIGDLRADEWAIGLTYTGSDPPADSPTATVAIGGTGVVVLEYSTPAQLHGTTVKCRLQTRRLDGAVWRYSEGSSVVAITADATGPVVPTAYERYRGRLPEDMS